MATVLKDNTDLEDQYNHMNGEIQRLEMKLSELKEENRTALIVFSCTGAILLFVFSAFHPLGGLIGAFAGWYIKWYRIAGADLAKLNTIKKELSPIAKGYKGESAVTQILEHHITNDYVLINDLTIPTKNGNGTQIDHVLVTKKVIICIETKNIKGIYYPHKQGWLWYPPSNSGRGNYVKKKTVVSSPQRQSAYHANQLRHLLRASKINIPVMPIVVLTNENTEWKGKSDRDCPVIQIHSLRTYIENLDDTLTNTKEFSKEQIIAFLTKVKEYV